MHSKWADVEFTVLPYKETKDTFMLGGIDEIMVTLEDSMVTMALILTLALTVLSVVRVVYLRWRWLL